MDLQYKHLLDGNFHPDSRVWIYQSSRLFTINELLEIEETLKEFLIQWDSHGVAVKGSANLFFAQFIVLIADETATGVGGCSTDRSVRMIKEIEKNYSVNMFERTTLAFAVNGKVQMLPMAQLQYAVDNGTINGDTLYFNNLVQTKQELESKWLQPVKDSWLAKKFANVLM